MSAPPYRLWGRQGVPADTEREAIEAHRLRRYTLPPTEPHSAQVIRDLELFINGRVLSAPKEGT